MKTLTQSSAAASILLALCGVSTALEGQPQWSLGRLTTVIADDGTPERQFTRVVGAVRLPNGSVLIADGGSAELRLFGEDGKYIRTLARRGSGPGELQNLEWLKVTDQGVAAGSATGYSLFSTSGAFLGRKSVSSGNPSPGRATLRDVLAGGQGVFLSGAFSRLVPVEGVRRDSTTISINTLEPLGEAPLTVGRFAAFSTITLLIPSAPGGIRFGRLEYAPQLVVATGTDVLWIGNTDSDSAIRVSPRDASRVMIRLPIRRESWNREELAKLRTESERIDDPTLRAFNIAQFDRRWLPGRPPLFTSFASDKQNNLWIERFAYRRDQPQSFVILSPIGRPIGSLQLARRSRVLEVGADYLVVSELDENDVERVVVHTLIKK